MSENIETLRWNEDHFEMIDQRILPAEFEYISYTTANQVADGIRDMVYAVRPPLVVQLRTA